MIDTLEKCCKEVALCIETKPFYRWSEEHKQTLSVAANSVTDFAFALAIYYNTTAGQSQTCGQKAEEVADDLGEAEKSSSETEKVLENEGASNKQVIVDGLKSAEVEYKLNPTTGKMEPYMKQFTVNDDYKVLLRRDYGAFNHNDPLGDHWNLEVQTIKGRTVYDLHIYLDDAGNILPITEDNLYIPSRSPFNN